MEDVIIIGGGPVGFINALGLAQAGVRVSVIEAEAHIINSPRAAVYFWSVLGGLGRLGEAEAAGVRKQDYTYLVRRTGERIVYSMEILKGHTPRPYNLHLGQHRISRDCDAPVENLFERDCPIRHSTSEASPGC